MGQIIPLATHLFYLAYSLWWIWRRMMRDYYAYYRSIIGYCVVVVDGHQKAQKLTRTHDLFTIFFIVFFSGEIKYHKILILYWLLGLMWWLMMNIRNLFWMDFEVMIRVSISAVFTGTVSVCWEISQLKH